MWQRGACARTRDSGGFGESIRESERRDDRSTERELIIAGCDRYRQIGWKQMVFVLNIFHFL